MKFSIITVVYNDVSNIKKTISSVLDQLVDDFEYLIIDGNSVDGTLDIIKEFSILNHKIKYISEPDQGIYDAMNKGLFISKGDYICYMNSGDKFYDNKVLLNVFNFLQYKEIDIIYGSVNVVSPNFNRILKAKPFDSVEYALPFCHQSVFVRRNLLINYKFNIKYKFASDYDQFLKIYFFQPNVSWKKIDQIISVVTEGGAADKNRLTTATEYLAIAFYYFGFPKYSHFYLYIKVILSILILNNRTSIR